MNALGTQLSLFETRSSADPFAVRVSPRARRLTARVHVGGRVEIVVPVGVSARTVRDFVQRFTPWIDRKVAAMQCHVEPAAAVPRSVHFAFSDERFEVAWIRSPRRGLTHEGGRLLMHAEDDSTACLLLRSWLKSRGSRAAGASAAALGRGFELSGGAGGHTLPAHALGKLLDARYRELELLAGLSASRDRPVSLRP